MSRVEDRDGYGQEGLTCIPQRIHCGATPEGEDETDDEAESLQLSHFYQVLAGLVMSVTKRCGHQGSSQEEVNE